jgi:hypothetical protein
MRSERHFWATLNYVTHSCASRLRRAVVGLALVQCPTIFGRSRPGRS